MCHKTKMSSQNHWWNHWRELFEEMYFTAPDQVSNPYTLNPKELKTHT